ncbi:toll/interleukin-1 receptor domain-containing protein [Bacillus infantis]|uniref:TIR domain-containing protein n=1 Tax=Bacillus infantis TaxID=324767 RepID=A0A5D4RIV9_9BACI|nr:toll/interleukin-1 receptor domain-containing protein [Bacillus infantis]TYS51237.1 TIR domain-containing protein [Bacillus infantis]
MSKLTKIFISHSSRDAHLARSLMDMLQTQFNLHRSNFFLTSDDELKIGEDWIETIRSGLEEASIVLPLITPNFLESQFCLCELGASWVNKTGLVPVIIPPLNHNALENTPYSTWLQTITLNSIDDLSRLAQAMIDREIGEVNIPRFNTRAKTFFNELLIPYMNEMKDRPIVTAATVKSLMKELEEYKQALESSEKEVEEYRKENQALRSMKDAEEIKEFDYKSMDEWENFEEKTNELQMLLRKLPRLVPSVIFQTYKESRERSGSGGFYSPTEQADLKRLENEGYIIWDDGWVPNDDHPRIIKIQQAIKELQYFMDDIEDDKTTTRFEEEYEDIMFDLIYSPFWEKVLGVSIYHSGS